MFKFQLIDLFWVTGIAACIAGTVATKQPEISFVGTACILFFIWHRPVMLRFWTIAMIGIGTAVWISGAQGRAILELGASPCIAWGVAMVVGGALGFLLFGLVRPKEAGPQHAS